LDDSAKFYKLWYILSPTRKKRKRNWERKKERQREIKIDKNENKDLWNEDSCQDRRWVPTCEITTLVFKSELIFWKLVQLNKRYRTERNINYNWLESNDSSAQQSRPGSFVDVRELWIASRLYTYQMNIMHIIKIFFLVPYNLLQHIPCLANLFQTKNHSSYPINLNLMSSFNFFCFNKTVLEG